MRNMVFKKCLMSLWNIWEWCGAVRVNSNESVPTGFRISLKKKSYIW